MQRHLILLMLALIAAGGLIGAAPASAAPSLRPGPSQGARATTRCFDETGYCVSGPILDYWERNGGLPVFGYPIGDLAIETNEGWTGPTQWFQRDRLEDHGSVGVLAGRLGADLLERQGRPWESFPQVTSAPQGCHYFSETGHSLCGVFLRYWEQSGGLERFGYPIAEPFEETLPGWSGRVQYFERRRMEHHADLAGTKYEVLLGLLGREVRHLGACYEGAYPLQATIAAYRVQLGCPSPGPRIAVPLAVESFERGAMIWVKGTADGLPDRIYVTFFDNARNALVWQVFVDTWREGDPVSGKAKPPAGLYEPIRGFGKLWRENQQVHDTLGWATAPEQGDTGVEQPFVNGGSMIYHAGADRVYIFYNDGRADDIARIP
jgi:hypothetical protein